MVEVYRRMIAIVAGSAALSASAAEDGDGVCSRWNGYEFFERVSLEVVKSCLTAGADPNRPDELRTQTPLHLAAKSNPNPAVIETLLDGGADATLKDERGKTPGDLAEGNPGLNGTAAYRRLKEAR